MTTESIEWPTDNCLSNELGHEQKRSHCKGKGEVPLNWRLPSSKRLDGTRKIPTTEGLEFAHSLVNEAGAHCSHSKKSQPGKVPLGSARGTADDFLSLVPCCSH